MTANAITREILLAIPQRIPGARAWRNNTGAAVPYAAIQAAIRLLVAGRVEECLQHLRHQRPIAFGIAGQADITGILPPDGRRLEIEVKADGDRHREAQQVFGSMVQRCGGVYVVARSVDEALKVLKGGA